MWHSALQIICLVGAAASTLYCFIALSCVVGFRPSKNKIEHRPDSMPISLLKPLAGTHRLVAECLASACTQDYSGFEVIFGVADPNDPVIPVVEAVMRDFPNVKTKLVICRKDLGTNRKVSSLIQMLAHAQNDTIVINDSDILMREDYLHHI